MGYLAQCERWGLLSVQLGGRSCPRRSRSTQRRHRPAAKGAHRAESRSLSRFLLDGTTEDAIGPYLNDRLMSLCRRVRGFSSNVWMKFYNFFIFKTDVMAIVAGRSWPPTSSGDNVRPGCSGLEILSRSQARSSTRSPIPFHWDRATWGWPIAAPSGAQRHRRTPARRWGRPLTTSY